MMIAVHELIGMSIEETSNSIPTAIITFFLGVMLHYIFDFIPHWDYLKENEIHVLDYDVQGKQFLKFAISEDGKAVGLTALDFLGGFVLGILIFKPVNWTSLSLLIIGGIGGALPDILQGFYFLFPKNRFLSWHKKFHDLIHTKNHLFGHPYFSTAVQALVAVSIILLLR